MRILAVDDERLALENIMDLLREVMPEAETIGFTRPTEAFAWLSVNQVDIAFLDIEMGGMGGMALAKKCKDLCPHINIIFATGYDSYALDAMRLHASGYLIKPVREKDLITELGNLRNPVILTGRQRAQVQTFGNFELFVDNKPLEMPAAKCKECLAYLIDRRGALITKSELATMLWGDFPYDRRMQNNIHRVVSDLMKCLKDAGIDDIIIRTRKEIAVNTDKVDCDYYRFLRGDVAAINAFRGEYMSNYGWSEFVLTQLVSAGNEKEFL